MTILCACVCFLFVFLNYYLSGKTGWLPGTVLASCMVWAMSCGTHNLVLTRDIEYPNGPLRGGVEEGPKWMDK